MLERQESASDDGDKAQLADPIGFHSPLQVLLLVQHLAAPPNLIGKQSLSPTKSHRSLKKTSSFTSTARKQINPRLRRA